MHPSSLPYFNKVIGGKIIARCFKTSSTTALSTVFEDDQGSVCRLSVYNLTKSTGIFPPNHSKYGIGTKVTILHPWYKRFFDGWPGLRVDDPETVFFGKTCDQVLNEHNRLLETPQQHMEKAIALEATGNSKMVARDFNTALSQFRSALDHLVEIPPVEHIHPLQEPMATLEILVPSCQELIARISSSAAEACLALKRRHLSVFYCRIALKFDPLCAHALSLLKLVLLNIGDHYILHKWIPPAILQADKAVADLDQYARKVQSHLTRPTSNFCGPLEFSTIPGPKERGLIAKERIPKGSILLVEDPCIVTHRENDGVLEMPLVEEIIAQLRKQDDPLLDVLRWLHPCGNIRGLAVDKLDLRAIQLKWGLNNTTGLTVSDIWLIKQICRSNCFSTQNNFHAETLCNKGSGLYFLGSGFNHSCLPNAFWFVTGDKLVVRATKDIQSGEEVTISYRELEQNNFARQKDLKVNRGFTCACERCTSQPGSPIWDMECGMMAQRCTHCARILNPDNLSSEFPRYRCNICNIMAPHLAEELEGQRKAWTQLWRSGRDSELVDCMVNKEEVLKKQLGPHHAFWLTFCSIMGAAASRYASCCESLPKVLVLSALTGRVCKTVLELPWVEYYSRPTVFPVAMRGALAAIHTGDMSNAKKFIERAYWIFSFTEGGSMDDCVRHAFSSGTGGHTMEMELFRQVASTVDVSNAIPPTAQQPPPSSNNGITSPSHPPAPSPSPSPSPSPPTQHTCAVCRKISSKYCSRCHLVWYCSAECQRSHWPKHKPTCNKKP
ncbi:hypothetical protein Pelo_13201 [Pelomyxa schiedti]|nr:hypothetical protein Pelo_13201 [Pelomyxa schiedti]